MNTRTQKTFTILFFFTIVLCCFFFFTFTPVHAQFSFGENSISLAVTPQTPEPFSEVTVTLDDYSVSSLGLTISWFVDGVEKTTSRNGRSLTFTAGKAGEETVIKVVLMRNGTTVFSSMSTIIPATIDLVLEANTYVPTFYKGRALPSTNSTMRAIALVNDGTMNSDTSYTYKWTLNDDVLMGGPVKGKNVVSVAMPQFEGGLLTVEVYGNNGGFVGSHSVEMSPISPELHFYEWSPLRGLAQHEFTTSLASVSESTTIFGEPYYMNTSKNLTGVSFTWKLDGNIISTNQTTPNQIMLEQQGNGGSANVDVSVVSKDPIPQLIKNAFKIIFE